MKDGERPAPRAAGIERPGDFRRRADAQRRAVEDVALQVAEMAKKVAEASNQSPDTLKIHIIRLRREVEVIEVLADTVAKIEGVGW